MLEFFIDNLAEIGVQTLEHLWITVAAMIIATILGIFIGVILTRSKKLTGPILGIVGVFQTIPSLALLGFMIPIFGIGVLPAIIALFLYALLPIVRNTYTGIIKVDKSVKEAAIGMGMTDTQLLTKIELPLATPVIFAGIRTAFVINVGVATLCALIAAGGLGEFIFRGISMNNVNMIFAGAIPAATLALGFDYLLGRLQKKIHLVIKPVMLGFGSVAIIALAFLFINSSSKHEFTGGFLSEFIHREDGFQGLKKTYNLKMDSKEMDAGLMYDALKNGDVDIVSGFSTDGRIKAYQLKTLEDDKHYFPPYYAAPMVRGETLRKFPQLKEAFELLSGNISNEVMTEMNYRVDEDHIPPRKVAAEFLKSIGLNQQNSRAGGDADIIVGSKNFTESYILAEMFDILIESQTQLTVDLKLGFGGTKLNFDAMENGEIDLYPEYTGTALLLLLQPEKEIVDSLIADKDMVFEYVKTHSKANHDYEWLPPLGFNNTFAILMKEEEAGKHGIESLSDLSAYLSDSKK